MNKKHPRNKCLNCGEEVKRKASIYCCQSCASKHRYRGYIYINANELNSKLYGQTLRTALFSLREHKCETCGNSKWLNKPIVLEVHHIDGNSENNCLNNLQLLCPNCHAMTDNYKAKNKGNGRKNRRVSAPIV